MTRPKSKPPFLSLIIQERMRQLDAMERAMARFLAARLYVMVWRRIAIFANIFKMFCRICFASEVHHSSKNGVTILYRSITINL